MDGARYNKETKTLSDSIPGEIYSVFPVVHLIPKERYNIFVKNIFSQFFV